VLLGCCCGSFDFGRYWLPSVEYTGTGDRAGLRAAGGDAVRYCCCDAGMAGTGGMLATEAAAYAEFNRSFDCDLDRYLSAASATRAGDADGDCEYDAESGRGRTDVGSRDRPRGTGICDVDEEGEGEDEVR